MQQAQAKIEAQEKKLVALREQHKELAAQVADKKKLLEQEQRIRSLEEHRRQLQPGDACPLCGAHEHPAIADYAALDVSATENALKEKQAALEKLVETGQQARNDLTALETTHKAQLEQQGKTAADADRLQTEWGELLAGNTPLAVDAWQDAKMLAASRTAAEQAQSLLTQRLQAAEQGEQALNAARKTAADAAQALLNAGNQQKLLQQTAQTGQQRQVELAKAAQAIAQEQAELDAKLGTTLSAAGYELPAEPTAWLQERDGEWQHWQQTQKRRQELAEILVQFLARFDAAQTQAAHWQDRWKIVAAERSTVQEEQKSAEVSADPAAALARCTEAIADLTQQLAAQQGRQAQLAANLAEQKKALADASTAWQTALAASPFADLAAYENALLPAEERQRLLQLKEARQLARQQAAAVLKAAGEKLLRLQTTPPPRDSVETPIPPLPELDAALAQLDTTRRELSEQLGAQRALLSRDEQARQNQQVLFKEIAAQTTESDLWQRLDSLIGSAKGDKFRKFAQGLTLDHLLHLANTHLARLHGRYLLRRKTSGELELDIVDSWQGEVARDTRTLSGGESFLVSLALALGLSDLVSHKTSIDSLFLDEGFGTLDADTLEIALNALDTLNASGKMIGVISHVEGMKERIPGADTGGKRAAGLGIRDCAL